jgi:hypothetical protein
MTGDGNFMTVDWIKKDCQCKFMSLCITIIQNLEKYRTDTAFEILKTINGDTGE